MAANIDRREFIAQLYELPLSNRWLDMVRLVEKRFDLKLAALGTFSRPNNRHPARGPMVTSQTDAGLKRGLDEFTHAGVAPVTTAFQRYSKDSIIRSTAFERLGLQHLDAYQEMLIRNSVSEFWGGKLHLSREIRISLNLYRQLDAAPLPTDEEDLLADTVHHLGRAVHLASRASLADNPLGALFGLMIANQPVWLFNRAGALIFSNRSTAPELSLTAIPPWTNRQMNEGKPACLRLPSECHNKLVDLTRFSPRDVHGAELFAYDGSLAGEDTILVTSADFQNRDRELELSLTQLTPSELVCLEHLLAGRNEADIADRLAISDNTVRFHRKNLYQKLAVGSKHELILLLRNFL